MKLVLDTSALMAILLNEPSATHCRHAIENANELLMSAGTLAECLIVSERRNLESAMDLLVTELGIEIVTVTASSARRVADTYKTWGKSVHAAGLNFGDCFAYELSKQTECALLFVGDDFSKTDVMQYHLPKRK